jgi:cytochrome P450
MTSSVNVRRIQDLPMDTDREAAIKELLSWGEVFQDEQGTWYLTSAEAVQVAARQPNIFSSARAWDWQGSEVQQIPVAIDPPNHARYRRALDPMIRPAIVNQLEPELRRQVAELIDAFADRGHCDVIADLAALYPTQVFLTLYGLPLHDRDMLTRWVRAILGDAHVRDAPSVAHEQASTALFAYVRGFIKEKRESPGEDMISRLIQLEGEDAWTDDELLGATYVMIIAGLDTVRNALGLAFHRLATDTALRQQIVDSPDRIPDFVEELLRIDTVAMFLPRVTTEDTEVLGRKIPAGSNVLLAFAAANRDPGRYGCPHAVDVTQAEVGHFSFGAGVHRCLGSHLARRELMLVLQEFHKRIPHYELTAGVESRITWPALALHYDRVELTFPTGGAS